MEFTIYRAKDVELVEGCKRQNRNAQKRLYEQYASKWYALCCRYIKDRMEAEDVLIIAFTKILNKIDQYTGEGNFEGWMRKVIVNEALSYLRKNKNMYLETDIEAADYEPDYENLEKNLEAEDLLKMIDQLPTGYRIVFNLFAIEGYSHQEIGEQLGISESTSKSQLSRARASLQKSLQEAEQKLVQKFKEYEQPNRSTI
ncbi:MAG: RNA polymerase sigma factor [Cyclobacteriaceae bacterium]|jgi:RNA polymerase sigma factor (sigma-70 family)|nr:RNA polymerase sigma factor [Cyclobacteriaceae bacterium]